MKHHMPSTTQSSSKKQSHLLAERLKDAIFRHLKGEYDFEERTPLDELIAEACNTKMPNAWAEALLKLARIATPEHNDWWVPLEFFAVQTGLKPEALGSILEEIVARHLCTDVEGRSSIYSLLAFIGKQPTAATLLADEEMRQRLPIQWLDLIIVSLPEIGERQSLVLEAVRNGAFTIDRFAERLDEVRVAGGSHVGDWLNTLRAAFPVAQRSAYDQIVSGAFGRLQDPAVRQQGSMAIAGLSPPSLGSLRAHPDYHLAEERVWLNHLGRIKKTKAASGRRDVRELARA
jgi:hypothetical protein